MNVVPTLRLGLTLCVAVAAYLGCGVDSRVAGDANAHEGSLEVHKAHRTMGGCAENYVERELPYRSGHAAICVKAVPEFTYEEQDVDRVAIVQIQEALWGASVTLVSAPLGLEDSEKKAHEVVAYVFADGEPLGSVRNDDSARSSLKLPGFRSADDALARLGAWADHAVMIPLDERAMALQHRLSEWRARGDDRIDADYDWEESEAELDEIFDEALDNVPR